MGDEIIAGPAYRKTVSLYVYKVLKQVHPSASISNKAMGIMNSFFYDLVDRITNESRILLEMNNRETCTSREIQTSVRLVLPGELAKHAVSEGTKAVVKYNASLDDAATPLKAPEKEEKEKKEKKEKNQKKGVSRSVKAGLQFPVGRTHRLLRAKLYGYRIGSTAAVYTAAIGEYLVAEILELSGNAAKDLKASRITPRHLQLAIRGDEELDRLFPGIIPGGGTIPHIHKSLVRRVEADDGAPNTTADASTSTSRNEEEYNSGLEDEGEGNTFEAEGEEEDDDDDIEDNQE